MRNRFKDKFYVYEHWRPDLDICFYVGKGHGDRGRSFNGKAKNDGYKKVIRTLKKLGMCVEVRMVACGMENSDALKLEKERIAFWRECGVPITNKSKGGQGTDKLCNALRGRKLSRSHRRNLSISHKGIFPSKETRKKLGEASRAVPRTDIWRERISKSVKASWHKRADIPSWMKGKKHTESTRKKMSDAKKAYYAKRRIEVQ